MAQKKTTYDGKTTDILQTNVDHTMQPQATSKADVDAQDYATRLWQSLYNSYQSQMRDNDEQTQLNKGQNERSAASRGMGHSSYLTATLANLDQKGLDTRNQIYNNLIADYQSRLSSEESTDRQLAANYISSIISAGGTPSDDLLRRAGLSRADAMAMIKPATSSGSGRSNTTQDPTKNTNGDGTENPTPGPTPGNTQADLLKSLDAWHRKLTDANSTKSLTDYGLGRYRFADEPTNPTVKKLYDYIKPKG